MLNKIWMVMILGGIVFGAVMGRLEDVTKAAMEGANEAIALCFTMAGVVALWMGLMEIAKESGLVERMTKGIAPFLYFLFPKIPKGHPALGYIATNVIANLLGLGWACTPAGLKAMEALAELETERGNPEYLDEKKNSGGSTPCRKASNEMCTFLILNISSLQLIPINVIAYRSQYGSTQPTAVMGPAIMATLAGTVVAVIFCKMMDGGKYR